MSNSLRSVVVPALVALVPAGFLAWAYRTSPANYAADYAVGGAWVVAVAVIVLGALIAIPARTRGIGAGVCVTGVLILVEFFALESTVARRAPEPPLGADSAHDVRIPASPP